MESTRIFHIKEHLENLIIQYIMLKLYTQHFATDHCDNSCIYRSKANCSHLSSVINSLKTELCDIWAMTFWWSYTWSCWVFPYQKQKTRGNVWPKSDLGRLRTSSSDTREFLKQYVFDWEAKQLFRKWSPTGAGRHERVDYWLKWHWHYGSVC